MKRTYGVCSIRIAVRIIGIIMLGILLAGSAQAATLTVCKSGCAYSGIQDAVDAASSGDTIQVQSGTYYENVNVNKQLILRGIEMPVVDANGSGSAITLSADGIRLEGFTATGSGLYTEAGIKINSNNNMLSGNNVSNNDLGINLFYSRNNEVYNNFFNNTNNFYSSDSYLPTWNTTITPGTNIIHGPNIGGNYWANPNGTGFSQTCIDSDSDGICNSPYFLNINNIDYLPLAYPFEPPTTPTVIINLSGIIFVNKTTENILGVDYWNFNATDPYNISITRIDDNSTVYIKNGTLKRERKKIIPINWTPQDTRQYLIEAKSNNTVNNRTITVYDFEIVSPIPELSTLALISAGLVGLSGLARIQRKY
ncbi:MAG TPA: NosD domain-containing protein [Candidatus Methylomirabilis sp.]|nr:NosD domain-containing protein [Candidatus Methylomirabilis sp.]